MFIIPFFIIITAIIAIILNFNKKFTSIITMYLFAAAFLTVTAAIYISKTAQYKFPIRIDYSIYLFLSSMPIRLRYIVRLYNLSFAVYMFTSVWGAKVILNIGFGKVFLLSLPIAMFLVYCDPAFSKSLYIYVNTVSHHLSQILTIADKTLNFLCIAALIFYMIFPMIYMHIYNKRMNNPITKRFTVTFLVCITTINIFILYFFVIGTFRHIMFFDVNAAKIPRITTASTNYITSSAILLICVIIILILLVYTKPYNLFDILFIRKKNIKNNMSFLNKNLGMNLHVYKNAFWGCQMQFEIILNACRKNDLSRIEECAQNGIKMINEQISSLSKTISFLSETNILAENINIIECIYSATEKVPAKIPDLFEVRSEKNDIYVFGNKAALTECFLNLFKNSIESFRQDKTEKPKITVTTGLIGELCIIDIIDNGCGIPKSELKNIFKPFHSTKPRINNNGIGLSYAETIVKSHHGIIAVTSVTDESTCIHLAFPTVKVKDEKISDRILTD